jgi:hypothetical protein
MRILSTTVQPSYGKATAIVRWTVDRELAALNPEFAVYRSPDGAQGWELVAPPGTDLELTDPAFIFHSLATIPHYRVLAMYDDPAVYVEGPTAGLFDELTRREFGVCRRIMDIELRTIRIDGWDVLHYIPLANGVIQKGWIDETGQEGYTCPGTDDGFGQKFVDGYAAPWLTVMHPSRTGPIIKELRDDGLGIFDENKIVCKMLAFPRPVTGHLIIHPETDNRYVVTSKVQPHLFKGTYPVAFTAQLRLLEREHPAYRLPIPEDLSTVRRP